MARIGVAFVGTISAGKTTLLNALFTKSLGEVHIKKSTLLPHIYHECVNERLVHHMSIISENTFKKNSHFMTMLEDKKKMNELNEIHYNVNKLNNFVKFQKDVRMILYDIPGLNDSTTKKVYYDYLDSKFSNFDIVIWTIDVNSAINTSDEIDICNHLIKNIKNNYDNWYIKTKLIVLLNKCDDMYYDESGHLILDDEKKDMYNQAKKNINNSIKEIYPDFEYQIVQISSENAYIYRTLEDNPMIDIDIKYLNKLGYNEYGKTEWNSLSHEKKKMKIREKLDPETIRNRMMNTGFNDFKNTFQTYIDGNLELELLLNRMKFNMIDRLCSDFNGIVSGLQAHNTAIQGSGAQAHNTGIQGSGAQEPVIPEVLGLAGIKECKEVKQLIDFFDPDKLAELSNELLFSSSEYYHCIKNEINDLCHNYDVQDNNSNQSWNHQAMAIKTTLDVLNICIVTIIDTYELMNKTYIQGDQIQDGDYDIYVKIKSFYDKVISSFQDVLPAQDVLPGIKNHDKVNKINVLMNQYNILRIDNTVNIKDKIEIFKILRDNKCDNWKQILIQCISASTLIHDLLPGNNVIDFIHEINNELQLNDQDIVDIVMTLLDKQYADDFKMSRIDNILLCSMFWDGVIIRSTNIYFTEFYKMKCLLNRYIAIQHNANPIENIHPCALEEFLFDVLKRLYPGDYMKKDDLLKMC
jgi:predicted GTPase